MKLFIITPIIIAVITFLLLSGKKSGRRTKGGTPDALSDMMAVMPSGASRSVPATQLSEQLEYIESHTPDEVEKWRRTKKLGGEQLNEAAEQAAIDKIYGMHDDALLEKIAQMTPEDIRSWYEKKKGPVMPFTSKVKAAISERIKDLQA